MISLLVSKVEDERCVGVGSGSSTNFQMATTSSTMPTIHENQQQRQYEPADSSSSSSTDGHDDVKSVGSQSKAKKMGSFHYSIKERNDNNHYVKPTWIKFILWKMISCSMDSFLFVSLLLFAIICWMGYVHEHYLRHQLAALEFTDSRSATDITYFRRHCGDDDNLVPQFLSSPEEYVYHKAIDITSFDANELWISPEMATADAVEHQLKHGFTVFENVLSHDTINALREHINYENYHTKKHLYVIEQEHRFSILLNAAKSTAVAKALEEIANHPQLSAVLDDLLGPNAAMIELTAISSSYGAVEQFWHEDTNYENSAMNNAKAFSPLYSLFIQLQNTSVNMGVTQGCPGTHYCTNGPIADLCTNYGVPVAKDHNESVMIPLNNGTDHILSNRYWPAGDALLMNMDSIHRGSAHKEVGGLDRIMLIISFTPKPKERSPTRQMSNGITFQCQWDMWGHTLDDMKTATKTMQYPWVMLKSLGLYNYYQNDYGFDYITASSQRMINYDNGYTTNEFDDFIQNGGIVWLPSFLQKKGDATDFYPFFHNTYHNCYNFFYRASMYGSLLYMIVLSPFLYMMPIPKSSSTTMVPFRRRGFNSTMIRLLMMGMTSLALYHTMKYYVDHTDWAMDIHASRRFTSVAPYEEFYYLVDHHVETNDQLAFYYHNNDKHDSHEHEEQQMTTPQQVTGPTEYPTTYPTRYDVLLETRYGVKEWGSYRRFIEYHPGNVMLQQLIVHSQFRLPYTETKGALTDSTFPIDIIQNIISTMKIVHYGRFLYQLPDGAWGRMNDIETIIYVWKEIQKLSMSPLLFHIKNEIRYIMNAQKYGTYRSFNMIKYHTIPSFKQLEQKLFLPISKAQMLELYKKEDIARIGQSTQPYQILSYLFASNRLISKKKSLSFRKQRNPLLNFISLESITPKEPFIGAWLESGNVAEIFNDNAWYVIQITHVGATGTYRVANSAGSEGTVDIYNIRRLIPFQRGQSVAILTHTENKNRNPDNEDEETEYDDEYETLAAATTSYYEPCTYLGVANDTLYARKADGGGIVEGFSFLDLARLGENDREAPERFDYSGTNKYAPST